MIDQERFQILLKEAMHGRTQKAFAEVSGLSKYTLNRYLTNGIKAVPRQETLRAIAEASEGRVSLKELELSVGKYQGYSQEKSVLDVPAEIQKQAEKLKDQVKDYIASPAKHQSPKELVDILKVLYANPDMTLSDGEARDFVYIPAFSKPYRGAERIVPVDVTFTSGESSYHMLFVILYCETKGTAPIPAGIIALDTAWSLQELSMLLPGETVEMMDAVARVGNVKLTDYPFCLWKEKKEGNEEYV